jgi:hypothetical protein
MKQSIDLSKLTREEKIELLALLDEQEKRSRLVKELYKPHAGQMRVHMSEALERYLFPGNGFGKSVALVNEVHWAMTGWNPLTKQHTPVPAKAVLILDTPEKVEDFITEYKRWHHLDLDKQAHKRGKPHFCYFTWDTGSTLTVVTHDVTPTKLEGSQWTHIFIEEPPPKPVFTAVARGGRIKGRPVRIFMAGTPVSAAWLRTDIYEPWSKGEMPHVECFKGRTEENKENLDEGYIERFSSKLSEQEKAIRLRGEFFDLEGLALAHLWRRDVHTLKKSELEWEESFPCVVIVDPHPSKAHHAVLLGADKDNFLYVLDEYKEKAIARKFTESLVARGWFQQYSVLDIVYDSLGSSETTSGEGFRPFGEVMNEVLKKHGIGRARATSYQEKDDEEWIERIQDALVIPKEPNNFGQFVPKLRVLEHCRGTISDIENVQWKRDKAHEQNKPKLDISNKDFLSCVKYGLACNLHKSKKKDKAYYRNKPAYGVKPQAARRMSIPAIRALLKRS